jgi:hypothetical protein
MRSLDTVMKMSVLMGFAVVDAVLFLSALVPTG